MKDNELLENSFFIFLGAIALLLIIIGLFMHNNKKEVNNTVKQFPSTKNVSEDETDANIDISNNISNKELKEKNIVYTEEFSEYDYVQVPVNINKLHLKNNNEWLTYYSNCKNADSYVCPATHKNKTNFNFIKISGKFYKLPFSTEDIPEKYKKEIMKYSIQNKTQKFEGDCYFYYSDDEFNYQNGLEVQVYPSSNIVNAIGINKESSCDFKTDLISIAGLNTNMSEKDVINKYGEGFVSNNDFSNFMIQKYNLNITEYQSRIYKNGSAILVVTFDNKRKVESIFLYDSVLNRDPEKEAYTITTVKIEN